LLTNNHAIGELRNAKVIEGANVKIDGGCHCGFIGYQAEADPANTAICNCTDCQRLSGSAFRTVVPVDSKSFRMTGEPTVYVKTGDSGNKRQQTFCPRCGSPIYSAPPTDGPRLLYLRVGTINQRDQFVPQSQVWARSQQAWVDRVAAIPKNEKQ
jgi:hypothetical protein